MLIKTHQDFDSEIIQRPPETVLSLTQVGYTGFRWATFIEPFWNAYYLALVISIADQIESQRIPEASKTVFSYRFQWQEDTGKLFRDSGWSDFRRRCMELSETHPFVVQTDIADYYPRIYHHRIENALARLPSPGDIPKRIMKLLESFSKNVSYGLPIGGPASRILAELALNGVDTLLTRKGIKFCRYADDYAFFCQDKAEAYRTLVFLAEKLFNEGLVLQKKKTRILEASEFREISGLLDPAATATTTTDEQKLLNISIRFDPYSPTAAEDYEHLKGAVNQIDIIGILGREISKTNIDPVVTRQAIQAIQALDKTKQEGAILILLDPENLATLAPVFAHVMRITRKLYSDLSPTIQGRIDNALCELHEKKSPLLSVEVNQSYYIQALSENRTPLKEKILAEMSDATSNPFIRRMIIICMSNWRRHDWVSDVKTKYDRMSTLERRAFILASYSLGDEGSHWRKYMKKTWIESEILIRDWAGNRVQTDKGFPL
ncbi:RNA-directed DNA polymerase [Corallococcus llansteffanensis]|uniref:RNA-directed DNA polymerase n=1 Tax=Corallococcus llansteffanensis TaxID=2316731 RepID=A0A3A8NGL1_9BACT|nr:RNA-directed DNA polymerase [Corallococcus llansteffanensis]